MITGKTGRLVFVIGGVRSGKSSFALERAGSLPGRKAYVATAESRDDEMEDRIQKHRAQRGRDWSTIEEPIKIGRVLKELRNHCDAAVIDCLTLWLTNLLLCSEDFEAEMDSFFSSLKEGQHPPLFIVSNEVGMGIVPDNALSRKFGDLAGQLNQRVAQMADEVYLLAAGIPLRIKP